MVVANKVNLNLSRQSLIDVSESKNRAKGVLCAETEDA